MKKAELENILKQIAQLVAQISSDSEDSDDWEPAKPTADAFDMKEEDSSIQPAPQAHKIGPHTVCATEQRGFATPNNRSIKELVLDASEGFIPLWAKGVVLRWRFNERSMLAFRNPTAAKAAIRNLLSRAISLWGGAAPVGFKEAPDAWDFEIVVQKRDDCDVSGCVLASAFFPDAGRHRLYLYPQMFAQSGVEQVETLAHEIGHIFGLRHFFALLTEQSAPAIVFGTHSPFSIMNYGEKSTMTANDRNDLKRLYSLVWSGQLTEINGTPIRLFKPYHQSGSIALPSSVAAMFGKVE